MLSRIIKSKRIERRSHLLTASASLNNIIVWAYSHLRLKSFVILETGRQTPFSTRLGHTLFVCQTVLFATLAANSTEHNLQTKLRTDVKTVQLSFARETTLLTATTWCTLKSFKMTKVKL